MLPTDLHDARSDSVARSARRGGAPPGWRAGSGKTRAIVARIVRLLPRRRAREEILGITFTKPARGMRERVAKAIVPAGDASVGDALPGRSTALQGSGVPWLGTFHAFAPFSFVAMGTASDYRALLIYDTRTSTTC